MPPTTPSLHARAQVVEMTMTQSAGTPLYAAPEVMRRERYDETVDVWSFGCCLECMWTHAHVVAGLWTLERRRANEARLHSASSRNPRLWLAAPRSLPPWPRSSTAAARRAVCGGEQM